MKEGETMKKRVFFIFFLAIFLSFIYSSLAQFLPEEVTEWEKWEEFLETAQITDSQQMISREAVTQPWVLTLEKDGIKRQALWKDIRGRVHGFEENWKWEIAAYLLDKLLDLNMVPPTVQKEFKGDQGSCQLMVDYWISLKAKYEKNIDVRPRQKIFYWNRALRIQRAFDNLIANEDRHQNNFLITEDWRLILIDHSRSFRTSKKFTQKLIYDEKYKEGPRLMETLPRVLFEKIKTLNPALIRETVGEYLTDKEIESVLIRKDLIVDWINKRIEKLGEENVLY